MAHRLRSSCAGDELDPFLGCKPLLKFHNETLPTKEDVIGFVIHFVQSNCKRRTSYNDAYNVCAQTLRQHWMDRNIYPESLMRVKRKVSTLLENFRKLKDRIAAKRGQKWKEDFLLLANERSVLFDIFCEDKTEREALEKQNVKMQQEEFDYLESMRTDRMWKCEGIDKAWHEREEMKQEKYKRKIHRENMNSTINVENEVEENDSESLSLTASCLVADNSSDDEFEISEVVNVPGPSSTKRKSFTDIRNTESISPIQTRNSSKLIPQSSKKLNLAANEVERYVRLNSHHVRDEIYETCAELSGHGFSYHEAQVALKVVANRLFGCAWTIPDENRGQVEFTEDEQMEEHQKYDNNTLPTRKAIRYMMERIEAMSLNLIAKKLVSVKDTDDVVTHATDSTTRKKVGCFAPQGLHINCNIYLPLPTMEMASETTHNVSESVITGFKILEAASEHSAEDLYACVDLHMTDATAHNKGIAVEVADLLGRKEPAGQLFCNPHTALGFDRTMKKCIMEVEQKMDMTALAKCFVLDININQQSDTVSLSVINWILNLFGPDLVQKPWNYHSDFQTMLKKMGKVIHLFHMKDARFGLLSLSCAICIFHWSDFNKFLDNHEYITNKLACLVRDGMQHEYVMVIACVCAAYGIHLIIPFHYKTKGKSDHSTLRKYFKDLYDNLMSTLISKEFFEFSKPMFTAVSERMFDGVKSECGLDVLKAVTECAKKHAEECILLANMMAPELANTLSMQRGKYYEFGTHTTEYEVFKQAANVDKSITHNLQLERECGDHDNRLLKKCNISTVSRDNILKQCTSLRDENSESFRACSAKVNAIKKIKNEWKERQAELKEAGLSAKESAQLKKENRKLKILEELKAEGGPFTNAESIETYIARDDISEEEQQKRMKNEVTFARESTRSIPAAALLFRIMKTDSQTNKRRTLTAAEFAANLSIVLGKKNSRGQVSMEDFLLALWDN